MQIGGKEDKTDENGKQQEHICGNIYCWHELWAHDRAIRNSKKF